MTKSRTDLLQGTLDLLVLKTLSTGARHGWGISQWIHQMSKDVLQVNQGSLYPALHRLDVGRVGAQSPGEVLRADPSRSSPAG